MEIVVNNKKVEYYEFGTGTKTMIMVPGVGQKSCIPLGESVANAYKKFADDFTVYLIERANDLNENDTLIDITNDYIKVFETLGLKDLYIFGASYGGMIAQTIAILRPDLVKKMVLVSTSSFKDEKCKNVLSDWLDLTNQNKLEELTINMLNQIYSLNISAMLKENSIKQALELTENELDRFKIQLNTMLKWSGYQELKKIKCPTFIIAAKGDKVINYNDSIDLNDSIQNSKIYLYDEDKPHAIYDEVLDLKNKVYDFFME